MKTIIVLGLLLYSTLAMGQALSYTYDKDGNLTSRYAVTLRSSQAGEEELESAETVLVESGQQKITVYPNPTKGQLCIEIQPLPIEEENLLKLMDASGRLIEIKKIDAERTCLDITGPSGIYLLNIHLGQNISKWTIIKQ